MDIGELVGLRVRELRTAAGVTQDQLARACRRYGIEEYSGSRIGQIESGAVAPTATAMVALALGLGEVLGRQLTLADLIPDVDNVQAGRGLTYTGEELREFLRGAPVGPPPAPRFISTVSDPTLAPGWGSTDDLAVANWGVPPQLVRSVAESLWGAGETLTRERDRRAGVGATPQKRGRITRDVIAEAKAEFDRLGDAGQL
jgi:transcriptional regulator with XRE-family HTH domain